MPDSRNRLRHLVPLAAVQGFGLACGLIGVRWTSELVPPEVMGAYGVLLSTQLLGVSVTHQGLVQHAQRYWAPETAARPYFRSVLAAARWPTVVLGAGLAAVLLLLRATGSPGIRLAWWPWALAINACAVAAYLAHTALQAEQRYWTHFVMSAIGSASRTFIPLLLVVTLGATLRHLGEGFLAYSFIWAAAGLVLLGAAWRRTAPSGGDAAETPGNLVTTFATVGLCGWLAANAVRWIAAFALSPRDTGFFILALNLAGIVPAAVGLIGVSYTFPPLFAAARAGATDAVLWRMTLRTVVVALVIGQAALLLLAWCAPWLIGLVISGRYAPSLDWLLAAGGAGLATISGTFFSNQLMTRQRTVACVWLAGGSAAFRLTAMLVLASAGHAAFRIGLALLPWPTALLEWWIARRWFDHPGSAAPAAAAQPSAASI